MPNAKINTDRQVISGRGEGALLAWKLGSKGRVIDDVVGHRGIDGGRRVYRTIRGGRNNKYTAIIAIQIQDMANAVLAVF